MLEERIGNTPTEPPASMACRMANKFLIFRLGYEEYGIEILKVQKTRGYELITQIANTPEFIKEVVNLRGILVPIMDMRIKFRLGNANYDQFTIVIILNVVWKLSRCARQRGFQNISWG